MNLELREVTAAELAGWDELVRKFAQPRVEHTYAWIQSLAAVGSGRPLFLVWTVDGEPVGCLPGLLTKVGPLTLFGSPLPGWQTGGMGPLFDATRVTTSQLISALLPVLEERYGVDHIEMLCPSLDTAAMAQLGFRGEAVPTYRAPLFPGDETRQLKAMKDSARRNLKRAQRLGIQVKFVPDDERSDAFPELHYAQLRDVYVRGGNAIPFGLERVRETFRHARDAGRLIAVTASLADGETIIASGMFATEGKELLLWSWAHSTRYRWYRATELLTWAVMAKATERGCDTFDFMGLGDFKAKFGATLDHSKTRWVRSRTQTLTRLRDTAARLFGWQQAIRGRLSRALPRVFNRADEEARAVAVVLGDVHAQGALRRAGVKCASLPGLELDGLLRYGWAQPEPPALFYGSETELAFVTRHRDRLSQAFRFVLPAKIPAPVAAAAENDTPIESYHAYVDEQGKVAGEFTGRQTGLDLETTDAPDVQSAGRSAVQKLKLRGVASIDFQRGPDGALRLLRVVPWFNHWHQLGARAGVNLPALVYADLVGADRPAPAIARAGVRGSGPRHDVVPSPRDGRPPVPARSIVAPAPAVET